MKKAARRGMKAYVLIETSPGKAKSVKHALARIRGATASVTSLDGVTGPYDFIAMVEGPTLDAIGRWSPTRSAHQRGHPHDHVRGGGHRLTGCRVLVRADTLARHPSPAPSACSSTTPLRRAMRSSSRRHHA